MKKSYYFLFVTLLIALIGCQKNDGFTDVLSGPQNQSIADFFSYGEKVTKGLVSLIQEEKFLHGILEETNKRVDGDFEVLVRDILQKDFADQGSGISLFAREIAKHDEIDILEAHEYLSTQMNNFPNLLIGYRHNIPTKEEFEAQEPKLTKVVLVDGNHREGDILYGINEKFERVQVDKELFLTVQKSERHDELGNLNISVASIDIEPENQGALGSIETRSISSPCSVTNTPEPTGNCLAPSPPSNFTASLQSGFVQLSWNGNIAKAGTWNRYIIQKVEPINGLTWNYTVYACGFVNHTVFQTGNLVPNTNYQYRIKSVQIKDNNGASAICESNWTNYISVNTNTSVVAQNPQTFSSENSLTGKINFAWQGPANGNTTGYEIDHYTTSGNWNNIKSVGASTLNTVYNHPSSWKGKKQLFRIRNKWGGNFSSGSYDIVYPAYRSSGAPVYMHRVQIPNLDIYELPELGYPEVHLAVTKAVGTTGGSKSAEGVTGLSPSAIHHYQLFFKWWPRSGWFYPGAYYQTAVDFFPSYWMETVSSILPINLINNWYVDQYNKVLFVNLAEVDETEEHATTKKVNTSIDAKYTTKGAEILPIPNNVNPFDLEVGAKKSTEVVFAMPEDNISMGSFDLFYWENLNRNYGLQGSNCIAEIHFTGGTRINK